MSILNLYKTSSTHQLQLLLSAMGALAAAWVMYNLQGWVNDDSVLYFEAARQFSSAEWKAGLNLFPWPLYSLLISGIHVITGFSIHLSAQILNTGFIFISFLSLLKIITLASGDKLTLIIATMLLLGSSYIFGDVVGMLLRDQGFWAFMLTALVFFIQYYREGQLKDAIYWQIFAMIALLFRIEAFTYIALLPLLLLTQPEVSLGKKFNMLFKAYVFHLIIGVLMLIAVLLSGSVQLNDLGRIKEIFSAFSDIERNLSSHIATKVDVMAASVLGEPLKGYAWTGLLLTLILVVVTKCVLVAGLIPAALIAGNYKKIRVSMSDDVTKILLLTALIVIINGILIILKVNLLSSRYVIMFGLIAILFASFSARGYIQKLQQKQLHSHSKILLLLAALYVFVSIILNVLPKEEGYNYQKVATDYVKTHNTDNKKVFYVSPRARYYADAAYAGRGYDYWEYTKSAIENGSIYEHDYLVINLDVDGNTAEKEAFLLEKLQDYSLIKIVYGYKKKKRMLIYKKKT